MKIKLVGVLIIVLLALSLFSFVIAKDDLPSLPGGAGEGDKEKIEDAIEKGKEIFPFDPETGEFKKTKAEERIAAIDLWMEEHASWMKVVFGMVPEISWLFAVNLWIILWLVVALILNADFALLRPFSNENLAAKTAGEIFKKLNTYNKKSVDKIQFNIALNSGDLITSLQDKKLKYTSIGNTILLAKKIADQGENQILVSGNLRTKLSRTLKAQKAGTIGNLPYYSVNRIVNTTENQEKLKDILKRMKR